MVLTFFVAELPVKPQRFRRHLSSTKPNRLQADGRFEGRPKERYQVA